MKRHSKHFSVEIKKSRGPHQHHQLLPKRLFEMAPAEAAKIVQKDEVQIVAARSPARRILPSIVEPLWRNSEPVKPVRCERSAGEADQGQIRFDLNAGASGNVKEPPVEAPGLAGAVPQVDDSPAPAEYAIPDGQDQRTQDGTAKANLRKVRRKAPERVETVIGIGSMSQPERVPKAEAIESLPIVGPITVSNHRQTKRQTAAAELPRHERWKRRLHAAAW